MRAATKIKEHAREHQGEMNTVVFARSVVVQRQHALDVELRLIFFFTWLKNMHSMLHGSVHTQKQANVSL
jgi:hypothetical protein